MSFGPLVGVENVKQGILSVLSGTPPEGQAPLLVYYLAEIERQNGLVARTLTVPPSADSYYGGVDFLSWDESYLPSIIVVTEPEDGAPERDGEGYYGQWFQSQIAAVVKADTPTATNEQLEAAAQAFASFYGTAIAGAILHYGSLGDVAQRTQLVGLPRVEALENDTPRTFARAVVTIRSFVQPLVGDMTGPSSYDFDPYATPPLPVTVSTFDTVFTATNTLRGE